MAKQTVVTHIYTDDLTGETVSEKNLVTREFGFKGKIYTLDLSKKSAERFDAEIGTWVDRATVKSQSKRKKTPGWTMSVPTSEIRAWAKANGWPDINERGRVPHEVFQAWENAQ